MDQFQSFGLIKMRSYEKKMGIFSSVLFLDNAWEIRYYILGNEKKLCFNPKLGVTYESQYTATTDQY